MEAMEVDSPERTRKKRERKKEKGKRSSQEEGKEGRELKLIELKERGIERTSRDHESVFTNRGHKEGGTEC